MALETAIGVFVKDSSGTPGATNVVALTFTPKAVLMFADHSITAEGDGAGNVNMALGFGDGTNNRCLQIFEEHNRVGTNSTCTQRSNAAISTNGSNRGNISFQANQFTVTWDANDTQAVRVRYIAIGGADITGVQVGDFQKPSLTTGIQSVALNGNVQNIQNNRGALLLMGVSFATMTATTGSARMHLGMTAGVSYGTATVTSRDAQATSFVNQGSSNASVYREVSQNSGNLITNGVFAGFTSTGFDIDWTQNDGSAQNFIMFLAVKGGAWKVGNETARTTNGSKTTNIGFPAKGLFTYGNRRTVTGVANESFSMNVGAATASGNFSTSSTSQNGVTTTNAGRMGSNTKTVRIMNPTNQAILAEAGVTSLTSEFTLDWTTTDGNAYIFPWLAFGDTPTAAGGLLRHPGTTGGFNA